MANFLEYMLFSSFEYLAIFVLIFSFFNIDFRSYRWEILLSIIGVTFVSYLLVIAKMFDYVPLPLILVPALILTFVKVFKMPLARSTIVIIGGFTFYFVVQWLVSLIGVGMDALSPDDLNKSFSTKTYSFQTLCAVLAISVGMYIKLTNGGFGFNLKSRKSNYKAFLYLTIAIILILGLVCISFYIYLSISLMIVATIVTIVSSIIFLYLSHKRDQIEYN